MLLTYGVVVADIDTHNMFIAIPIVISSITAIGSTVIPTIRGIESMADNKDLPKFLSNRLSASITVMVLIIGWSFLAVIYDSFFFDSIEAVSIMVGIYFTLSCYAAYKNSKKIVHLIGLILMAMITIVVFISMFDINYGETNFYGVGGVGVIVIGLLCAGIIFYFIARKNKENV